MDKVITFLKRNYPAFIIGGLFYLLYLQFTFAGNRICDCEKTEQYKSSSAGYRGGVNRFYHK